MRHKNLGISVRRGTMLVFILILTAAISLVLASMLTTVTQSREMTRRTSWQTDLNLSNEAALNFGAAQLASDFTKAPDRIVAPDASVFPVSSGPSVSHEIIATQAEFLGRSYVDGSSLVNAKDQRRNTTMDRRLCMLACRTQIHLPNGPIELCRVDLLEVRSTPIFSYLAFLDVQPFQLNNPGSDLTFNGPIFSNRGINLVNNRATFGKVVFTDLIQTPGSFVFSGNGSSLGEVGVNKWQIIPPGKQPVDMSYVASDGVRRLRDSSVVGFDKWARTRAAGAIGTGSSGVQPIEFNGINFVDDSGSAGFSSYLRVNNRFIDPPNPSLAANRDPAYDDSRVAEAAKIAYKAGLYVLVEQDGDVNVFTSQAAARSYKSATDKAAWKATNAGRIVSPAEVNAIVSTPFVERYHKGGTPSYTLPSSNTDLSRRAIYDGQNQTTVGMIDVDLGQLTSKLAGGLQLGDGTRWDARDSVTGWNGTLYVDVVKPNGAIMAPVKDKTTGNYISPTTLRPDPAVKAEDAMRVRLPSIELGNPSASSRLTAVRLKNAKTVPGAYTGGAVGFTLATNTAVYTVGSVNADGNKNTGDSVSGDSAADIPMAICCDRITVLSNAFQSLDNDLAMTVDRPRSYPPGFNAANWPFTGPPTGDLTTNGGQYMYQQPVNGEMVELGCGFMVGDSPETNYGLVSLFSFLQPFNTTSSELRVRGAVTAVFKPRYFMGLTGQFYDYYVAPKRTYGYSALFKSGKFPPGMPSSPYVRRVRQFELTRAEFERLRDADKTNAAWMPILQASH